jgi:hypothetical protein
MKCLQQINDPTRTRDDCCAGRVHRPYRQPSGAEKASARSLGTAKNGCDIVEPATRVHVAAAPDYDFRPSELPGEDDGHDCNTRTRRWVCF